MLARSLEKTYNLLVSANNFPAKMIISFAKAAPEEVRAMYVNLFDESKDLVERIESFKTQASILLEKYGEGLGQHYQNEYAISTYLWLRYPDKYFIYKYSEVKTVADILESDYRFKKALIQIIFVILSNCITRYVPNFNKIQNLSSYSSHN